MLNNPASANEESTWEVIDYTGPMKTANMSKPKAVYPVKDAVTNDNWNSNTIFPLSFDESRDRTHCFAFNFRTYESSICPLPEIAQQDSPFAYAYMGIGYQYRMYLFGGYNDSAADPSDVIQYAIFDYNGSDPNIECTWSANNGENTLDLRDFDNETIMKLQLQIQIIGCYIDTHYVKMH